MITTIRHRALKRFWTKGDPSGLNPERRSKVQIAMNTLEAAAAPSDMDLPGFGFHALSGDRAGRFAISISRNWRLTFAWSGEDATDLDLEDYHGR